MAGKKTKKSSNKKVKKRSGKKFELFKKPKAKKKKLSKKEKHPKDFTIFKIASVRLFGHIIDDVCIRYFESLKKPFNSADMQMMFRTYLAIMFSIMSLTFIGALFVTLIYLVIVPMALWCVILALLAVPLAATASVFLYMYIYPSIKTNRRKASIEANLPFAVNHMAAVAESGATPYSTFKVLAQFKEYGEISEEAEKIVRNMDLFGLDEISALRDVIGKAPSKDFKEFLEGLLTTIQTGGSLKRYLRSESREAMLNYRTTREKYTQMVSIYADLYTALLIAAPLVMIAILAILNVIGGTVFGLPIDLLIRLGIYVVVPLLNVLFLAFLFMTQPSM